MAKVVIVDGRKFVQPSWQNDDKNWTTVLNDNRRERKELNAILLQVTVDRMAEELNRR